MQVVGVALGDRIAKTIERPQREGNGNPDDDRGTGYHQAEAQSGANEDRLRQLPASDRRFGNGHHERHRVDAGRGRTAKGRDADWLAAERGVGKARRASRNLIKRRKRLVAGDELPGRAIHSVEDAILRRRGQHFQRHIGNVDLERPVLGDNNALGDRQSRTGKNTVRHDVGCRDSLAIGIGQCDDADDGRGDQQPAKQPSAKGIDRRPHSGLAVLSR